MGDVGSAFLGLVFGLLVIASGKYTSWYLWPWLILLSVFIADSTVTLLRRFFGGARWYEAHCTHAYQHASKKWGHSRVTLAIVALNAGWLAPLAGACFLWPEVAPLFTMLALAPLVWIAVHLRAGQKEELASTAGGSARVDRAL